MDRRNFIRGLLALGAGFTVLPGAGRIWKPKPKGMWFCEYKYYIIDHPGKFDPMIFHARDYQGEWKFVCDDVSTPTKDLLTVTQLLG